MFCVDPNNLANKIFLYETPHRHPHRAQGMLGQVQSVLLVSERRKANAIPPPVSISFLQMAKTSNPRRSGFTFSSSGTEEFIEMVQTAAFHDGESSISEFLRIAIRNYIANSETFSEQFKADFHEIDVADQLTRRSKASRFRSTRRRLELLAVNREIQAQINSP